MDRQFWHYFAIGFLIVNTLCVISLFEMLIYGRPYITLFFILFGFTVFLNRKLLFRHKKLS